MWPSISLPLANKIADIANLFFICSLVVGVVSTIVIVRMTGVKERYWEEDRQASAERIAKLATQGEQLKKETAEARAELGSANAEIAKANASIAEAQKEAAQARLEQERLKAQLCVANPVARSDSKSDWAPLPESGASEYPISVWRYRGGISGDPICQSIWQSRLAGGHAFSHATWNGGLGTFYPRPCFRRDYRYSRGVYSGRNCLLYGSVAPRRYGLW